MLENKRKLLLFVVSKHIDKVFKFRVSNIYYIKQINYFK